MTSKVTLIVMLALALWALRGYWQRGDKLDLFYAVAMLSWSLLIAISLLVEHGWMAHESAYVTRVIYQVTIWGLMAFFLHSLDGFRQPQATLLLVQTVLGVVLCALPLAGVPLSGVLANGWILVNAVLTAVLLLVLARLAWKRSTAEGWMVLLAAILGLGVIAGDSQSAAMGVAKPSVSDYFCAVAMLLLWLILTHRIGSARKKTEHQTGTHEHAQLAQDLHDGVGSHLASVIAALETGTPQQRATAMSLQHCLLELKMLVDGEGHDGSVLEHLACLRYRLQPLLQSAGIQMNWNVSDEDALEHLHGDAARQVLRVAQEALANVVRHSRADEVVVSCGYVKTQRALVLEIVDNGVGIPPGFQIASAQASSARDCGGGKGLPGMSRRARALGGRLVIEAAQGRGTRVHLWLPL